MTEQEYNKYVAQCLENICTTRKISCVRLSELSGVSVRIIHNILSGTAEKIPLTTLIKVTSALDITASEFFRCVDDLIE